VNNSKVSLSLETKYPERQNVIHSAFFYLLILIDMALKLHLKDFGKIYKVKILAEAFILCNGLIDAGDWWCKVVALNANSKSYKHDTIESTYGSSLDKLFSQLDIDEYVVEISSFLIFTNRGYRFVRTIQEADNVIKTGKRWTIKAVGVKIYHSYNPETKSLGKIWEPTALPTIEWFYLPRHFVDLETTQLYNSIDAGDMIAFKKTQAFVASAKILKRSKFWITCSWTKKKITILNGSTGRQIRLTTSRNFTVIKTNNK